MGRKFVRHRSHLHGYPRYPRHGQFLAIHTGAYRPVAVTRHRLGARQEMGRPDGDDDCG